MRTVANPLMLQAYPLLHIQDRKEGGTGGGRIGTISSPLTRDLNYIALNELPAGCGIKPDNTTLHSSVGWDGSTTGYSAIINNPVGGPDVDLSRFVLTEGTYVIEYWGYVSFGYITNQITNITDGIDYVGKTHYHVGDNTPEILKISIGSTKEFKMCTIGSNAASTNTKYDLGDDGNNAGYYTTAVDSVHTDIKIYKIG